MAQEPLSMRPETAVELSQLVSLLEAPAFAPLRLQLLQPGSHPALLRAAHGLLMLLPQGDAFRTLQARLQSVPIVALLSLREAPLAGRGSPLAAGGGADGGSPPGDAAASPSSRQQGRQQQQQEQRQEERTPSPQQRQSPPPPRPPLIEEKRLVQLFKSRAARLAGQSA
jgi:vacuole morphology and inheritance protein 14